MKLETYCIWLETITGGHIINKEGSLGSFSCEMDARKHASALARISVFNAAQAKWRVRIETMDDQLTWFENLPEAFACCSGGKLENMYDYYASCDLVGGESELPALKAFLVDCVALGAPSHEREDDRDDVRREEGAERRPREPADRVVEGGSIKLHQWTKAPAWFPRPRTDVEWCPNCSLIRGIALHAKGGPVYRYSVVGNRIPRVAPFEDDCDSQLAAMQEM